MWMYPLRLASLVVLNLIFSTASSAIVQHYCGTILSDALHTTCKQDGFPLHFPSDHSVTYRAKRGIVEECCINPCSKLQLRQYCNIKPGKPLYSSKRKRSHSSINLMKRTKGKSNSHTTVWQCENKSSTRKGNKSSSGSRRRRNRTFNRKAHRRTTSSIPTTTEVPWFPEVQYVDDWTDSGEAPIYVGSGPLRGDANSNKARH